MNQLAVKGGDLSRKVASACQLEDFVTSTSTFNNDTIEATSNTSNSAISRQMSSPYKQRHAERHLRRGSHWRIVTALWTFINMRVSYKNILRIQLRSRRREEIKM